MNSFQFCFRMSSTSVSVTFFTYGSKLKKCNFALAVALDLSFTSGSTQFQTKNEPSVTFLPLRTYSQTSRLCRLSIVFCKLLSPVTQVRDSQSTSALGMPFQTFSTKQVTKPFSRLRMAQYSFPARSVIVTANSASVTLI